MNNTLRALALFALCFAGCDYFGGSGYDVRYRAETPGRASVQYSEGGRMKEAGAADGSWSGKVRAEQGEVLTLIARGSTSGPTRVTIEIDGKVAATRYTTNGVASVTATAGGSAATL